MWLKKSDQVGEQHGRRLMRMGRASSCRTFTLNFYCKINYPGELERMIIFVSDRSLLLLMEVGYMGEELTRESCQSVSPYQ